MSTVLEVIVEAFLRHVKDKSFQLYKLKCRNKRTRRRRLWFVLGHGLIVDRGVRGDKILTPFPISWGLQMIPFMVVGGLNEMERNAWWFR